MNIYSIYSESFCNFHLIAKRESVVFKVLCLIDMLNLYLPCYGFFNLATLR